MPGKPQLKNPTVAQQKLNRLRNKRKKIPENCEPGFLIRSVKTGSTSFVDVFFFSKNGLQLILRLGKKTNEAKKLKLI